MEGDRKEELKERKTLISGGMEGEKKERVWRVEKNAKDSEKEKEAPEKLCFFLVDKKKLI